MSPAAASPRRRLLDALAPALLVALALALCVRDLGAASFHDGDEALYAEIAREMQRSGDLLTPTYWGAPFLHKPPLIYWLTSASFAFGPSDVELAARLPAALFAIALVLVVYAAARRLGGVAAGLGAGLLLLSNSQWLFEHGARSANFDAPLTALMFAALVLGLGTSRRALVGSALCGALVMLVKLPLVGFVGLPLAALQLARGRAALLRWLATWAVAALVIAVPWHAWALATHGRDFWDVYVSYEILGRADGEAVAYEGARWFTPLEALARGFTPWTPLVAVAALAALCGWPARADERAARRTLAGYALLLPAFVCLLDSAWPWYVLPAVPALCVLAAVFVTDLARSPRAWLAPLAVAAPLALRLALVSARADYAPSARPSYLWPHLDALYAFGAAPWGAPASSRPRSCCCSPPRRSRRPARRRAPALTALLAAAGALALALATVAGVETRNTTAVDALCAELRARGTTRLLAVGFWHTQAYGERLNPHVSFYFREACDDVVDCGASLDCLTQELPEGSALVLSAEAAKPRVRRSLEQVLPRLAVRPSVWVLQQEPGGGFRELR
ncbi:MAG: glycosyltransferase family 39 protein [Planctomycetes bacterium]|nr:glycosyltransferase family 39 protein [Planctomycetota bacterium]